LMLIFIIIDYYAIDTITPHYATLAITIRWYILLILLILTLLIHYYYCHWYYYAIIIDIIDIDDIIIIIIIDADYWYYADAMPLLIITPLLMPFSFFIISITPFHYWLFIDIID
jgi:hypothetical protein